MQERLTEDVEPRFLSQLVLTDSRTSELFTVPPKYVMNSLIRDVTFQIP